MKPELPQQKSDKSPDYGVPYLPPPPPSAYGYATFFRSDPEVIARSRDEVASYRQRYDFKEFYPLRLRISRSTGLPATLNDVLPPPSTFDAPEQAEAIARSWLDLHSVSLFGVEQAKTSGLLRYVESVRFYQPASEEERGQRSAIETVSTEHVRYQQWHLEHWPVFGGTVAVHLANGYRRAFVSSSYFPIPANQGFEARIAGDEAIAIARRAAERYVETLPDQISKVEITGGEAIARPRGAAKRRAKVAAGQRLNEGIAQDKAIARPRPFRVIGEWRAEVVPYAGSELFVLPFAGQYHLAYRVELCSPSGDQALRIFVDAEQGAMLGAPEDLVAHAGWVYATSQAAIDGQPTQWPQLSSQDLSNAIHPFLQMAFHQDAGGGPIDVATLAEKTRFTLTEQEAINIAFHAGNIYKHFRDKCGADTNKLSPYTKLDGQPQQPGLRALVGKGGTQLDMGFSSAAVQNPKPVTFQTEAGQPLKTGGLDVHNPSLDPEVIMHEITHGLMWLLNDAPFDLQSASVPFGCALAEGYANYFAHSLAERQDSASDLWGRAAYREQDWQDRWSLDRASQQVGADLLPAPNFYPAGSVTGLPVYDVGMIWARALWEIRKLLADKDQADRLALKAYQYLHGWACSFEIAAEGLIDAARKENVSSTTIDAIIAVFAGRGILAERGVQALARAQDGQGKKVLLAGSDTGVQRSNDNGTSWNSWGQPGGAGVVALAALNTTVYAATEAGIYTREIVPANSTWVRLGVWPADQYPYALTLVGGRPYAGTGHGVLRLKADQSWESWDANFEDLVINIASGVDGNTTFVYVANLGVPQQRTRIIVVDGGNWSGTAPFSGSTAITIKGGFAYAGTLDAGIWMQPLGKAAWTQIARPADLKGGAVLDLSVGANDVVYAATTVGLFSGKAVGAWQRVPGSPTGIITRALPVDGGHLLVGTASQGVLLL